MPRFVSGAGKTNVDILYSGMSGVPQEGEEIYAKDFSVQLGGGIPATLINVGRLGVPIHIQTFLGQDLFSRFAEDAFEKSGVTPCNLYSGDRMPVNVTSAVITSRDRAFTSYSDPMTVTDLHVKKVLEASQGAAIVLMQEDFLSIYPTLKASGSVLVYDTGWREDMSLDGMREVLELADWYTPNEMEAMRITRTGSVQDAAAVLSEFFEHVIIKLGAKGCFVRSKGINSIVPAIPGVHAVDTTGAGDAFLAGFVYGLYHGASPLQCALYGNITGAASVEGLGCLSSYVDETELLERSIRYRNFI